MGLPAIRPTVLTDDGPQELPAVVRGSGGGGAYVWIDDEMQGTIAAALSHYFDNGPRHRSNRKVLRAIERLATDFRKAMTS